MTTMDAPSTTARGLHLTHPDATYTLPDLAVYFNRLGDLWEYCVNITYLTQSNILIALEVGSHLYIQIIDDADVEMRRSRIQRKAEFLSAERSVPAEARRMRASDRNQRKIEVLLPREPAERMKLPRLVVTRLQIASPLEMVVTGLSGTAGVYALHLLAKTLRNPRALGRWVPELRAGYHEGMEARARARMERARWETLLDGEFEKLQQTAEAMTFHPTEVRTIGIEEPPWDLRDDADSSLA